MASTSTSVGLALAGAAACAFEVSYVLQAIEVRRADDHSAAPSPRLLGTLVRRPLWIGAIALSIAGFGLQVLALRHAPLSLVQPVLALGLVLLLVLGRVVLGERAGRRELLGAAGVIVGVSLLVAAGPMRGGSASHVALTIACTTLGLIAVAPYAARSRVTGLLVAAAACADALAALAMNEIAGALSPLLFTALLWALLAGGAGILALTSESTALQRATVATVGPAVLAGQIAIPTVLAPLVAGDRWDEWGLVLLGLAVTVAATTLLASSPAVEHIRHPEAA
ncbi:MAG: EamA family transporter [Solirubrobacteraceae bacterium]